MTTRIKDTAKGERVDAYDERTKFPTKENPQNWNEVLKWEKDIENIVRTMSNSKRTEFNREDLKHHCYLFMLRSVELHGSIPSRSRAIKLCRWACWSYYYQDRATEMLSHFWYGPDEHCAGKTILGEYFIEDDDPESQAESLALKNERIAIHDKIVAMIREMNKDRPRIGELVIDCLHHGVTQQMKDKYGMSRAALHQNVARNVIRLANVLGLEEVPAGFRYFARFMYKHKNSRLPIVENMMAKESA